MKSYTLQKWSRWVVVAVALLISVATIFEGTAVLTGASQPEQIVLRWLVTYNVVAAFAGLTFLLAVLFRFSSVFARLWKRFKISWPAGIIALAHAVVLLALVFIYFTDGTVAVKSIGAMLMRTVVWALVASVLREQAE
ncbi:hypothetical protein [Leptonema illini]|jgi:hypothetical protein|uniref:Uncharacterized protein n=1 Tax=Leptonema illini DSM 21528 TaxID=929563 RepID=H2CJJ2_9LEPT|nr:hypothetical protein [Leptonema illini]EHQ07149.1 hypothetical protein Lepil_2474 [Leptonema illini DSM 21528]